MRGRGPGSTQAASTRSTGEQVLTGLQAHQICALMMNSGTYDASGETSFLSGLFVKSDVLAVIPGYGAICV
ncbi:MAG: glutaminase [Acidovorax sp.]|nr:glutaminase [Acidovorax sp.]